MWLVFLGLFTTIYILYHGYHYIHRGFYISLAIIALVSIAEENLVDCRNYKPARNGILLFLKKGRVPATLTIIFRKVHQASSYCCFTLCLVALLEIPCEYPDIVQIIFLFTSSLGVLSLLYFINLVSSAGHLLVILLKMMYDTMIFLLVGFVVFFTFADAFYTLLITPRPCSSDFKHNSTSETSMYSALTTYKEVSYCLAL